MIPARTELRTSSLGEILFALDSPPRAYLFWTTKEFSGHLDDQVVNNIREVSRPEPAQTLMTCNQIHGATATHVSNIDENWCEESDCDALWTTEPGVALAIKVADCLPVTLIDRKGSVVANVHAGWRGAAAGIVTGTIDELPVEAKRLSAWLGPSIRTCCFEVGHEVIEAFERRHGDVSDLVSPAAKEGRNPHLDLAGVISRELERAGIDPDEIRDTGYCTRCEGSKFHSYRRSGPKSGRNLAVTGLTDG